MRTDLPQVILDVVVTDIRIKLLCDGTCFQPKCIEAHVSTCFEDPTVTLDQEAKPEPGMKTKWVPLHLQYDRSLAFASLEVFIATDPDSQKSGSKQDATEGRDGEMITHLWTPPMAPFVHHHHHPLSTPN